VLSTTRVSIRRRATVQDDPVALPYPRLSRVVTLDSTAVAAVELLWTALSLQGGPDEPNQRAQELHLARDAPHAARMRFNARNSWRVQGPGLREFADKWNAADGADGLQPSAG
jgi:hypothetical protein